MSMLNKGDLLAVLQRAWPGLYALLMFARHFYRPNSYCNITGYVASLRSPEPVDARGQPVPWVCYSLIGFLLERIPPGLSVFEFGSGSSTLFFARMGARVYTVEHDQFWFARAQHRCPPSVRLTYCPTSGRDSYCDSIQASGERYDLVVVDGLDRLACLGRAFENLTPRGVVILDDSQRPEYADAFGMARAHGFRYLSFEGLKPCGFTLDRSTLFYRDGNCFGV